MEGVRLVKRVGVRKLIVESDFPLVVHAFKLKSSGSSEIYLLIDDILALVSHFDIVV